MTTISSKRVAYLSALSLLVSLATISTAEAALISCPASFVTDPTAKVTSAGGATAVSDCQYVSPPDNSNVASIANINAAGFFGFTDWAENPGNLQVSAGTGTGSWSISGANFAQYDYAIVFKDGNDTNLVALLLNELFSSGLWSTPFTDPPFSLAGGSDIHDASHYTIVQRDPLGQDVPEPGVLSLIAAGALAMAGGLRRRRRTK